MTFVMAIIKKLANGYTLEIISIDGGSEVFHKTPATILKVLKKTLDIEES